MNSLCISGLSCSAQTNLAVSSLTSAMYSKFKMKNICFVEQATCLYKALLSHSSIQCTK